MLAHAAPTSGNLRRPSHGPPDSEWRTALEELIADEAARRQAGALGRAFVETNFDEKVIISAWDDLFGFESLGFEVRVSSLD